MSSVLESLPLEAQNLLGAATASFSKDVHVTTETSAELANVTLLRLLAKTDLTSIASGELDKPTLRVAWRPKLASLSASSHFLGFQCSEFALPVRAADASLQFDFFSRPGFVRPRSVLPMLVMSTESEQCIMLAPVESFHEQVLAIVDNDGEEREMHWGLSGDLNSIPVGFSATLAIICGTSPRELIQTWGMLVRKCASKDSGQLNRRGRYADLSTSKLSMWTDNGASYWYRTEQGMDLPSTLEATIKALDESKVPVCSVELDSWFYRHEITRPLTDVQYLKVVPPTGMLRWEPREDVLGKGGIKALRDRLGSRPLILHSRHISSKSSYLTDPSLKGENWWVDKDRAHPEGPRLFRKWMQQAADWGATTYEQDWISEVWLGVRDLRAKPGRIAAWQNHLNASAKEQNVNLIWCMATPADMAQAVRLEQIVALRSCDDYRYAKDPSILWRWHLTVSCLLRSLGLFPFKDVFMSHTNNSVTPDVEGDPHAMLEACLAALSAGPVGIGDRLGRTNRELVMKTCRSDGVLIKPDVPLAALDRSLRNAESLLWAETNSGPWKYVVVIRTGIRSANLKTFSERAMETLELTSGAVLAYNWRKRTASVVSQLQASLLLHEWSYWVLCPIVQPASDGNSFALIGDTNAFATVGDRRFRVEENAICSTEISFDVVGVHGEEVEVSYWSNRAGIEAKKVTIPAKGWNHCSLQLDQDRMIFTSEP